MQLINEYDLLAKEEALDREMFHPPLDATPYHASAVSDAYE